MNAIVGRLISTSISEAIGLAAVLVTLAGIWLQWQRPSHLSEIEELVKDGKLPPDEGWQRLRRVDRRATLLVIAGTLMLLLAGFGWMRGS